MIRPSYEHVTELPVLFAGTVTQDVEAPRMHMTVQDYFEQGAAAVLELCRRTGLDDEFVALHGSSPMTAEHHLTYYGELFEGDQFTVHGRFLGRSDNALHMIGFIVDQDRGAVACTLEAVFLNINLTTRRAVSLPVDIAERADYLLKADRELTWEAPVCGAMGIRI